MADGASWVDEYGIMAIPDQPAFLRGISPLRALRALRALRPGVA